VLVHARMSGPGGPAVAVRSHVATDVRHGEIVPLDARLAYDVKPLLDRHADGSGLTIAVIGFEQFIDSDIATFRKHYGLSGPAPIHHPVNGGLTDKEKKRNEHGEVSLDIEVISAIAPKAQIISYEATNIDGGAAGVAMIKAAIDGPADIISYSWGSCDYGPNVTSKKYPKEAKALREQRKQTEALLTKAQKQGVTVFVSSGDQGAYDCQRNDFSDHHVSTDYPSDSAHVVSVGGTLLSVRQDGTYFGEAAWEWPLTNGGGGGGVNPFDAAPKWQFDHNISHNRALPDVSASASPTSGWSVFAHADNCPNEDVGCWHTIGGTSAATPFWAASMLIAKQYADRGAGKRHCFLAPALYALAYGNPAYPPFHDVTVGSNRHFPANAGFDAATGLGSPDVWNIARDLGPLFKASPGLCTR
jgi:subtilase family serine protease